jgi:hypothetical protein
MQPAAARARPARNTRQCAAMRCNRTKASEFRCFIA